MDVSQRTKPNTPVVTKFGHEDFVNQLSRGLELHLTTVSWRVAKYGQQIAEETLPGYTPPDVKEKRMTFVEDEIARFEADSSCDENDDSGREDATPCDLHNRPPTSVSMYVWKEPSRSASLGCIANGAESTGSERQREVTEELRSLDRPTTATRGPRRLRSTGDRNVRQQTSTTVTLSKLRSNARVVKKRQDKRTVTSLSACRKPSAARRLPIADTNPQQSGRLKQEPSGTADNREQVTNRCSRPSGPVYGARVSKQQNKKKLRAISNNDQPVETTKTRKGRSVRRPVRLGFEDTLIKPTVHK